MIEQNFILLIMNCKKYRYKATYQKETWLHTLTPSLIYYHVIGDDTIEKTIYLMMRREYYGLKQKTIIIRYQKK